MPIAANEPNGPQKTGAIHFSAEKNQTRHTRAARQGHLQAGWPFPVGAGFRLQKQKVERGGMSRLVELIFNCF
jgi:hypothetical protein